MKHSNTLKHSLTTNIHKIKCAYNQHLLSPDVKRSNHKRFKPCSSPRVTTYAMHTELPVL